MLEEKQLCDLFLSDINTPTFNRPRSYEKKYIRWPVPHHNQCSAVLSVWVRSDLMVASNNIAPSPSATAVYLGCVDFHCLASDAARGPRAIFLQKPLRTRHQGQPLSSMNGVGDSWGTGQIIYVIHYTNAGVERIQHVGDISLLGVLWPQISFRQSGRRQLLKASVKSFAPRA